MESHRKSLSVALLALSVIGISAMAFVFVSGLRPSQRASAASPQFDLSKVASGSLTLIPDTLVGESFGYKSQLLVAKDTSGSGHVWRVLTKDGRIYMPDLHWWRPMVPCEKFGPMDADGKFRPGSILTCLDYGTQQTYPWWSSQWRWRSDGTSLGPMDDMDSAVRERKGTVMYLN